MYAVAERSSYVFICLSSISLISHINQPSLVHPSFVSHLSHQPTNNNPKTYSNAPANTTIIETKHYSTFPNPNRNQSPCNANDGNVDPNAAKCPLCCTLICHCGENNVQDPSSESSLDTKAEYSSKFDSQSGPVSDGPGVVVYGSPHLSEETTTFDIQLSPKKALRAAMLNNRFASTIYKAAHQVEKSDPTLTQQERERLERRHLKEKARIEKEIRATEEAMRKKAQDELKMKREKEREAARMALQKMERTVEFNDGQEICREFKMLLCCSPDAVRNPLRRKKG